MSYNHSFAATVGVAFLLFTLSSCGSGTTTHTTVTEKPVFLAQTQNLSTFRHEITQEKTATIQSTSSLTLTSESAGTVSAIHLKEWQSVSAGKTIVSLRDSLSNYDLAVAQARNGVTLQQTSAETTKLNLENSIAAAEIAYTKALQDYNAVRDKNNLQLGTVVKQNKDALISYNDTYRNYLIDIEKSMTQYLYEADKILGLTPENKWKVSLWKPYLGAQSWVMTSRAEDAYNDVYMSRGQIRARLESNQTFIEGNTSEDIALLENAYATTRELGDAMLDMLQNSVVGAQFSLDMQTGWIAAWNGYRNAIHGAESGFIGWKGQTNTFLSNYKTNERATELAVAILSRPLTGEELTQIYADPDLKLSYETTKLNLEQSLQATELALKNAETNLNNAKALRDATIRQLNASVENARLSLAQAERQASRLSVTSPINGTITKIHAEVGQSVSMGTVMVEIAGNEAQALLEVSPRTALLLQVGDAVTAEIAGQTITGSITAVSSIASANMLSSVRIAFPDANSFIGQAARITLHLPESDDMTGRYLIPINAVSIVVEGEGRIHTYSNGTIKTITVRLGNMYGKGIEVITDLDPNTKIITNDISAYNKSDYTLREEVTSTHE